MIFTCSNGAFFGITVRVSLRFKCRSLQISRLPNRNADGRSLNSIVKLSEVSSSQAAPNSSSTRSIGNMSQWPLPRYHGLGGSSWKGSSFSASNAQGALNFLRHHRDVWRALPAAVAACLWSAQMIYFFVWFTTRPALPNGSWPRIGPSYAAFPFISCIGALRKWIFRSVSISVATLLWTAFGTDYCVGRRSRIGRFWRVGKLSLSTISSVFLVAVAFESVNVSRPLWYRSASTLQKPS